MVNTIKMVYIRVNVDLNCGVPLTNSPKTGDLFTLRAPRWPLQCNKTSEDETVQHYLIHTTKCCRTPAQVSVCAGEQVWQENRNKITQKNSSLALLSQESTVGRYWIHKRQSVWSNLSRMERRWEQSYGFFSDSRRDRVDSFRWRWNGKEARNHTSCQSVCTDEFAVLLNSIR